MTGRTAEAEGAVERAVEVLERAGSPAALAYGLTYRGAILALDRPASTTPLPRSIVLGRSLAADPSRPDLDALCLNYLGVVQADRSGPRADCTAAAGEPGPRANATVGTSTLPAVTPTSPSCCSGSAATTSWPSASPTD